MALLSCRFSPSHHWRSEEGTVLSAFADWVIAVGFCFIESTTFTVVDVCLCHGMHSETAPSSNNTARRQHQHQRRVSFLSAHSRRWPEVPRTMLRRRFRVRHYADFPYLRATDTKWALIAGECHDASRRPPENHRSTSTGSPWNARNSSRVVPVGHRSFRCLLSSEDDSLHVFCGFYLKPLFILISLSMSVYYTFHT